MVREYSSLHDTEYQQELFSGRVHQGYSSRELLTSLEFVFHLVRYVFGENRRLDYVKFDVCSIRDVLFAIVAEGHRDEVD